MKILRNTIFLEVSLPIVHTKKSLYSKATSTNRMNFRKTFLSVFLIVAIYGSLGCVSASTQVDTAQEHHHHETPDTQQNDCHTTQSDLLVLSDAKLCLSDDNEIQEAPDVVAAPYLVSLDTLVIWQDTFIPTDYVYKDDDPLRTIRLLL